MAKIILDLFCSPYDGHCVHASSMENYIDIFESISKSSIVPKEDQFKYKVLTNLVKSIN